MEQRHREHEHAQEMFATIARYLTSTLSQTKFCQQEGLAYSKFNYWLKQYRLRKALSPQTETHAPAEPVEAPADFIPLRVLPAEPAAQSYACVIEYPSGIIVCFNEPVSATVLAQLLHTTKA